MTSLPILLPSPMLLLGCLPPRGVCLHGDVGQTSLFYPWVMYILTVRITEAIGLPKLSLFSNYKLMLLLCHLRVN